MGCSPSKNTGCPVTSIEPEPRSKSAKYRPASPIKQSDRIVEDCIIVWFLPDICKDIENHKAKLRHIVSTIKMFTDQDQCIAYITSIRVEKIFFILPTLEPFLDSIRVLPQLEKIYIFNEKTTDEISSANTFSNIDNLCKQLTTDVELCELDLLVLTASPPATSNDLTSSNGKKQEAIFLYAQFIREIVYRLKFETNAKTEFVHFCRMHYANNPEQLRIIDDFEANYRPQKALWWLTRQSFIWRVLQRMPRTYEIDILYKLGFLVKHAHTQMTNFLDNNVMMDEHHLVVYRGKTMFTEKFHSLIKSNCNGLISFGNLFIGHTDKQIELDFIQQRLAALPTATGVLFEIHINPSIRSTRSPFTSLDIIHNDDKQTNHGLLFGLNTVFHIDSIDELDNTIWHIKLTLVADDDPQLLRIVAPLRSSEVHANPLSYMGKLFMDMEEYEHAEKFFLAMLEDTSVQSQPRRLVRVHNGLAANYMSRGEYAKALEQSQNALDVSLSYLPPRHTDLAPLYDNIGKSYFHMGEYQKAVDNYEKAVDLVVVNPQMNDDSFVSDLKTRIHSAKKLMNKNS
ncbi:unnamed protein product [Adineta ricciae]|uniref:Uncharacterized protein n=1 Tax=Adineta ricciae TaxID=249248 RepID=A0A814J009_ADIRI|nr:unnamed protein product [Adineta ricciae]CAF1032762.1 unnamed protein product [Adineta ricciae]